MNKAWVYFLDFMSGSYLMFGLVTAKEIAVLLGGIASILAAINHAMQIRERIRAKNQSKIDN